MHANLARLARATYRVSSRGEGLIRTRACRTAGCHRPQSDIHTTRACILFNVASLPAISRHIRPSFISSSLFRETNFDSSNSLVFSDLVYFTPHSPWDYINVVGHRRYRRLTTAASWTFIWPSCTFQQVSLITGSCFCCLCNNCHSGLFFSTILINTTFSSCLWFMIVPSA